MPGANDYGEPKAAQHRRASQAVLNESGPLSDKAGGHARGIEDQPHPIDVEVRIDWANDGEEWLPGRAASLDEVACVRPFPGPAVGDGVRVGASSGRAAVTPIWNAEKRSLECEMNSSDRSISGRLLSSIMTKTQAAIASLACVVLSSCGEGSESEPDEVFDAQGTLTLRVASTADFKYAGTLETCVGAGVYADVTPGAQMVVEDSGGKKLAVGGLGPQPGAFAAEGRSGQCVFTFSVTDIPAGQGPYSVAFGNRGEFAFNEADAMNLQLTIG